MLTGIVANLATIIVCVLLAAIVTLIIITMVKNKKKGKTSCGSGCIGCPMSGSCDKHKK